MSPDEILQHPTRILSDEQRASYFERGYLLIEKAIGDAALGKLRAAAAELGTRAEEARDLTNDFEFETPPGQDQRCPRQVLCAVDYHPDLWSYASTPPVTDIVADLVGPDVKFRESGLSFKAPGGRGFDWHQDIVFFPHSNLSPLMTLTFLEDVTIDMGPTKVIPGSHRGEIYDHYDDDGNWLGLINEQQKPRVPTERAVALTGPAGSILVTNCALLHAAEPNRAARSRPMVILGYSSADAVSFVDIPYRSRYRWTIVEGKPSPYVHNEAVRMKMPPDWSAYRGIR